MSSTNIINKININNFHTLMYANKYPKETIIFKSNIKNKSLKPFLENNISNLNEVTKLTNFLVDNNLIDFNEKSSNYDDIFSISFFILLFYFDKHKETDNFEKLDFLDIFLKKKSNKIFKSSSYSLDLSLPKIQIFNKLIDISYKKILNLFDKNEKRIFYDKNTFNFLNNLNKNFKNTFNNEDIKNIILATYLIKNNKIDLIDKVTIDKLYYFYDLKSLTNDAFNNNTYLISLLNNINNHYKSLEEKTILTESIELDNTNFKKIKTNKL